MIANDTRFNEVNMAFWTLVDYYEERGEYQEADTLMEKRRLMRDEYKNWKREQSEESGSNEND